MLRQNRKRLLCLSSSLAFEAMSCKYRLDVFWPWDGSVDDSRMARDARLFLLRHDAGCLRPRSPALALDIPTSSR